MGDIVSNILRKISFKAIRKLRSLLIRDFPSESLETFDTTEKVVSFTQEVLKFGASHVNRDRVFITGHQGSGKTSLSHSIRRNEPFLTDDENGLKETKLVNIGDQELEEEGIPQIEERKEGEYATWLHLTEETTEGHSKCLLSCYDMGGHTEYFNSQQIFKTFRQHT